LTNYAACEEKLTKKRNELKQLIDDKFTVAFVELKISKVKHLKEITMEKDDIKRQLLILESFVNYSKELTQRGSPCQVSRSVHNLIVTAEGIKTSSSSVPEKIGSLFQDENITSITYKWIVASDKLCNEIKNKCLPGLRLLTKSAVASVEMASLDAWKQQ
jgi:hypothetical protein